MRTPVPNNRAIQSILIKTRTCIPPFSRPTHRNFTISSPTKTAKMTTATPFKIHLTPDTTGLLNITQTPEAAETVSSLLQQDLEVTPPPGTFPTTVQTPLTPRSPTTSSSTNPTSTTTSPTTSSPSSPPAPRPPPSSPQTPTTRPTSALSSPCTHPRSRTCNRPLQRTRRSTLVRKSITLISSASFKAKSPRPRWRRCCLPTSSRAPRRRSLCW